MDVHLLKGAAKDDFICSLGKEKKREKRKEGKKRKEKLKENQGRKEKKREKKRGGVVTPQRPCTVKSCIVKHNSIK